MLIVTLLLAIEVAMSAKGLVVLKEKEMVTQNTAINGGMEAWQK
ncbi:hypothetical protein [Bacillus xiamenensis]|nr:hypothetical protein [Bacillus xiamenensis]